MILGATAGGMMNLSASGPQYPLDAMTGGQPLVAAGGHRLRSDYSGPGIRLIRTDLAEQDIPYRVDETGMFDTLDADEVLSFLGSSTGRMITLYNQGTGGNFTKLDDLRRPFVSAKLDEQGVPYLTFIGPMLMAAGAQTRRNYHVFAAGDLALQTTPGFFYTMGGAAEANSMGANGSGGGIRLMPLAHTTAFPPKNRVALYEARSSAAEVMMGVDEEFQTFAAVADATANGGQIGSYLTANSYWSQFNLGTVIAMGNRTLANASAERIAIRESLKAMYNIAPAAGHRLFIVGDSIAAGNGAAEQYVNYTRFASQLLPQIPIYNFARGGDRLSEQNPLWATKYAPELALYPTENRMIAMSCLGNDILAGLTAAQIITHIQTFCTNANASGAKIILTTIMPAAGMPAGMVTTGETINAWIRANWMTVAHALNDQQAHPQMGVTNTQALYPSLWFDARHPNATGHAALAPGFAAAVASLM